MTDAPATTTDPAPLARFDPAGAFGPAPDPAPAVVVVEAADPAPAGGQLDPLGLDDWRAVADDDRGEAIPRLVDTFHRRTAFDVWEIGCALRVHRQARPGKGWRLYLASIGMDRGTARRWEKLADHSRAKIAKFASVEAALDALKLPAPAPTPALPPAPEPATEPAPAVVVVEAVTDAEAEAAVESVAAEAAAEADNREAEREASDERLSIRLEGEDGEAVDVLNRQADAKDERHRQDVQALNAANRRANTAERKVKDMINDMLPATPSTALAIVDDVLQRYGGVARKEAA